MPRALTCILAAALALSLSAPAIAAPADQQPAAAQKRVVHKKTIKKRAVTRHWRGYGFLPGYRPPEVIARERAEHYGRLYGRIITGRPGRASTAGAGTAAASAPATR